MIQHVCLPVASERNAQTVFEEVFEWPILYRFPIDSKTLNSLFNVDHEAEAIVYDAGNVNVEVFITGEAGLDANRFRHICLTVADRDTLLEKARIHGLEIRTAQRGDKTVFFLVDFDGNLYELKEES